MIGRSPLRTDSLTRAAAAVLAALTGALLGQTAGLAQPAAVGSETLPIDLTTALRLADERNRDIALFVARIDEAAARAAQARALAVPTLRAGSTYDRHHGNLQETSGVVVDVDRVSRYTSLGVGLGVDLADAIFRPLAARQVRAAATAAASANRHQVFAEVAAAYLRLVQARAEQAIVQSALDRAVDLAKLTADYAESGEGLPSDAEMAAVQPLLLQQRAAAVEERAATAAAELARLLHLEPAVRPEPLDRSVPVLSIFSGSEAVDELIARALDARPENEQLEALVGAAEAELSAERYGFFIPSVALNFTTGEFGGAPGSSVHDTGHRDDLTLMLYWQLDSFGLGNRARRDERIAQLRQIGLQRDRLRDAIAAEVRETHARLRSSELQMELAAATVERARASYELSRTRIYDQQGLPLEALAAMQTLASAELAALDTRTSYSLAQIRLHTALGNPLDVR
jgi:outer membrane protein TolC